MKAMPSVGPFHRTLTLTLVIILIFFGPHIRHVSADPILPPPRMPVCGDQDGSEIPLVFNCDDFVSTPDVQAYRVPGANSVELRFDFVFREAAYNNELGFFPVDDAAGSIDGRRPGDPGYHTIAFDGATIIFPSGSSAFTPDVTLSLSGGDILIFFIVQDNTLANLMANNPNNEPDKLPLAFFALDALNPDNIDHFVGFESTVGDFTQFGFEDLTYGGDLDFDDVVYNTHPPLRPLLPELVMAVHGHGANAAQIARSPADLEDPGMSTYRQMIEVLIDEFGEIEVFEYVEDHAVGGDSQSSVRENAIELAQRIEELRARAPDKKVTLIGFSMGTAIIRGYLALFKDAEQHVDAVIFLEGAHQGAWMLKVREGLSLWAIANILARGDLTWFLALTALDAVVYEGFNIDVNRPAAVDLTPQSDWYLSVNRPTTIAFDGSVNSEPVPPQTSYYNFYGDIGIQLETSLWRFRLRTPRVSLGDLALLPGKGSPIEKPLLGGAKFVALVDPQQRSEQWAMESAFRINLESIRRYLRGEVTAKEALYGLVDVPPAHMKLHESMHVIMLDDRVAGGGTVTLVQEIVKIVRFHSE